MAKKDKHGNTPAFCKLDYWIFDHPAYRTLSLGARALTWELIRLHNGYNNGHIFLSHRLAAQRLGRSRKTVSLYYRELEAAGFLIETRGHCLGPDGIGQSSHYALTHLSVKGKRPVLKFKTPAK